MKKGDIISFKKSSEIIIKKSLLNSFNYMNFHAYDNLEGCYKMFKIIVLSEKINLKRYLHHYPHFLNWSRLMEF